MSLDRVLDHKEQGLARLLTQYRDKPRLAAWLGAYLRQVQLLEDAIYDVLIKRWIDNAIGEQLKVIGRIVGEQPNDNDDPTFRIMILARIRINRSRGNVDDVLAVLALISATPVYFTEYEYACLYFQMLAVPDRNPVLIYSKLFDTKAAGVKLTLVVPTTNTRALMGISVALHFEGTDAATSAAGGGGATMLTSASAAFKPGVIGKSIVISGAATGTNNGTFPITSRPSGTQLVYTNAAATIDANDGALVYSIDSGVDGGASDPLHAAGDSTILRPTMTGAVGPFNMSAGPLSLTIDMGYDDSGITPVFAQSFDVDFVPADFPIPAAATAAQVLALLRARLPWNVAAEIEISALAIKITGRRKGTLSTLDVTGTAATALGFAGGPVTGTGDTTFGLAGDVVTVRQPLVQPPTVPGAPIISFVDPDNVDEAP